MKENRDKIYLERIIESINRAERFIADASFADFNKNAMMFDATLMQLINIGEMISHLSVDFQERYDHLPWHKAIGMRNQIAHGYFNIEPEAVWDTAKKDLPVLKEHVL